MWSSVVAADWSASPPLNSPWELDWSATLLGHEVFVVLLPRGGDGSTGGSRLLEAELGREAVGVEEGEHGAPCQLGPSELAELPHAPAERATEDGLLSFEHLGDCLLALGQLGVGAPVGSYDRGDEGTEHVVGDTEGVALPERPASKTTHDVALGGVGGHDAVCCKEDEGAGVVGDDDRRGDCRAS